MSAPREATQVWGYSTDPVVIAVMFDSWAAIDLINAQGQTFYPTATLFAGPYVSEQQLFARRLG